MGAKKLDLRSRLLAVLVAAALAGSPSLDAQSAVPQNLQITILDGEGALNNIKQRTAREPIVQVTDENHKPVAGAVVQLKNTKTLQIRSFITKEDGSYYFNGLSGDVDYELRADYQGSASPTRTLSSPTL